MKTTKTENTPPAVTPEPVLTPIDLFDVSARMQATCVAVVAAVTHIRADLMPTLVRLAKPCGGAATKDEQAVSLSVQLAYALCTLLTLADKKTAYDWLAMTSVESPAAPVPEVKAA